MFSLPPTQPFFPLSPPPLQIRILCQGQELPSSPISLQVLSASPVSPRAQSPEVSKSPVPEPTTLTFAQRRARIEEQFARDEGTSVSYSSLEMDKRRPASQQQAPLPQVDVGLVSFSGLSEPCSIGSIVEVVVSGFGFSFKSEQQTENRARVLLIRVPL